MSLELVRVFGVAHRQGAPELGLRRYGVPPGGAFDFESYLLANALVGAPDAAPCWELGLANATFRSSSAGQVSVVGAPVAVTVDGRGVPSQAVFPVRAGAEIHIGPPAQGARVYVAFHGCESMRSRRLAFGQRSLIARPLRIVPGPQYDQFDLRGLEHLEFTVGNASDRVGIRLEGSFQRHQIEIPSEPACVGAIQVAVNGELLILGPDGPTIGGYPKVAVVITSDHDRLGQLRPGEKVTFLTIDADEARSQMREDATALARRCLEVRMTR